MNEVVIEIADGCLRAVRAKEPVAVVLIDRDFIEAEYGTGDPEQVLRALAAEWPDRARALKVVDGELVVDAERYPVEAW